MGFRTVLINSRCKLEYKMNYLVCRGDEVKRIFISEISTLIISNSAVVVTVPLLNELVKNKVKVIFCDEKHNPLMELVSYYDSYNSVKKINNQINWSDAFKKDVWTSIVKNKIQHQKEFLEELNLTTEANLLDSYLEDVQENDSTNREGHSAKVYFSALFGKSWHREMLDFKNNALNYGYTIVLSAFNRELVKLGYLTQLGIWHKNQFNDFNLSCDFMEPFRVLVDRKVYFLKEDDRDFKKKLISILSDKVIINNKEMFVEDAISVYVQSMVTALNEKDLSKVLFFEMRSVNAV